MTRPGSTAKGKRPPGGSSGKRSRPISQSEGKDRLWTALTTLRDDALLGQWLLWAEVYSGIFRPVGLLAGSLAPRAQYATEKSWVTALPERVLIPLFERIKSLPGTSFLRTADAPEVRVLAEAYRKAGKGSSKFHIDQDDDLFELVSTHSLVRKYNPILPAPEEMPISGKRGLREVRMRSAEELLLAAGFADAYGFYLAVRDRFGKSRSVDLRLRNYARDWAELRDKVKKFQRLALHIRSNRQARLQNLLLGEMKTSGITEWRRLANKFFRQLRFRANEAKPDRDIIELLAQVEMQPPRDTSNLSLSDLTKLEKKWERLREAIRGAVYRKSRGRPANRRGPG